MKPKANNIVLIGMPASGKSTIGVLLAKRLLRTFIDTDVIIQAAEGKGLQQIIDTQGLRDFCRIEEKHILEIEAQNAVIATGGSAVYSDKAMKKLAANSTVIHLYLPLDCIKERLTNLVTRGVVMEKNQTLDTLFETRTPLYQKYADITVDCSGLGHEQTVDKIVSALSGFADKL